MQRRHHLTANVLIIVFLFEQLSQ